MAGPGHDDRLGRRVARLLLVLAVTWALALPLAARVRPASARWARTLASTVYLAGAVVCHQQPDRSFATDGRPWPVCARCTGLYAGAGLGALLLLWPGRAGRRTPSRFVTRAILAAAALPLAGTWAAERAGLVAFSANARAVTGVVLGCAVSAGLASIARAPAGRAKDLR